MRPTEHLLNATVFSFFIFLTFSQETPNNKLHELQTYLESRLKVREAQAYIH